jgi:hypothetical protein
MRPGKIFRSTRRDRILDRPFPAGKKSLKVIDNSATGGFIGVYERGPFRNMLEDDDSTQIMKRKTYCWLFKGKQEVGALKMVEYDVRMLFDDEFAEYLDRYSMEEATFSSVICSAWPTMADDVVIYGSIVHFTRLWVAPAYARHGEWADIANRILALTERSRALLVLKAFPLEYEAHGNRALNAAAGRRQRALVRHYRRLLDLKPLPGSAGETGWMYSIPIRRQRLIPDPVAFDPYEPE